MKTIKCLAPLLVAALLSACGGSVDNQNSSTDSSTKYFANHVKTTQAPVAADYQTVVQQLYVAYFGRPADPTGLSAFEAALLNAGAPTDILGLLSAYQTSTEVKGLIDSFGYSNESKTLYTGTSNSTFVTAIFNNVLSRQPEQAGLTFWTDALDAGSISKGDAALSIMAGALSNETSQGLLDGQLVDNRVATASAFTSMVSTQGFTAAYAGPGPAQSARSMLMQVTATTDSIVFQPTIQTTVVLISETSAALNAINTFRVSQGPSALTQSLSLYSAASAHAQYLAVNNVFSHFETSGMPGFTGEAPGNRAEYFNYPDFNVQEEAAQMGNSGGSFAGRGSLMVASLIDSVYHRAALLYQYETDIGVGLSLSPDGTTVYGTVEFGYQNSTVTGSSGSGYTNLLPYPTTVTGSYIGTYPLAGQTNVGLHMQPESPSPFPSLSPIQFATSTGYPISVAGPTNSTLAMSHFTVTQAGGGTTLQTTAFTGTDPNFGGNNNFAFIVPSQPLLANTTYNVHFDGTSDGKVVSMDWTFTTGSGT